MNFKRLWDKLTYNVMGVAVLLAMFILAWVATAIFVKYPLFLIVFAPFAYSVIKSELYAARCRKQQVEYERRMYHEKKS